MSKGPWEAKPCCAKHAEDPDAAWHIDGPMRPSGSGGRFTEVDARLIAAAPELLAACEDLLADLDDRAVDEQPMPGQRQCMEALRDVIAKAKGRSNV